jgi:hypothetical protein
MAKELKQLDLSTFTGVSDDIYELDAVSVHWTGEPDEMFADPEYMSLDGTELIIKGDHGPSGQTLTLTSNSISSVAAEQAYNGSGDTTINLAGGSMSYSYSPDSINGSIGLRSGTFSNTNGSMETYGHLNLSEGSFQFAGYYNQLELNLQYQYFSGSIDENRWVLYLPPEDGTIATKEYVEKRVGFLDSDFFNSLY